jgi:hypothetical protein
VFRPNASWLTPQADDLYLNQDHSLSARLSEVRADFLLALTEFCAVIKALLRHFWARKSGYHLAGPMPPGPD